MRAGEHRVARRGRRRQVHAAAIHRVELRRRVLVDQAVLLSGDEVLLAVTGRGVHGAGAVLARKSVVSGKSVAVRVDLGGGRFITEINNTRAIQNQQLLDYTYLREYH